MTIDERHEALTQTVELLTMDVRDLSATVRELSGTVREVTSGIFTLADIARSHESRITRLEQ